MSTTDPNLTALREGLLACRSCGFAVSVTPTSTPETITGVAWETPQGLSHRLKAMDNWPPPSITVLLCRPCREREESAHLPPALAARLGPEVGRERLVAALDGLAALGVTAPDSVSEADLIRHMNVPGQHARWIARFVPMGTPGQNRKTAARVPWAHVSQEQRAALRQGYAAVLAAVTARHAPERHLPPPSGPPGCLMCGIATVTLTASRVVALGGIEAATNSVWTHRVVTSPAVLGGRGSRPVKGHTCPECTAAIRETGSIGPTASERSYALHLREVGRDEEARLVREEGLVRLPCWVIDRPDRPNERRWGHCGRVRPSPEVPRG